MECHRWWFNIDRREADKQLLMQGNPQGTFLIRPSQDRKSYALSIRDFDSEKNDVTIKHYRIRKKDTGGVFISPKRVFENNIALVDHYRSQSPP
jgi:hypothetical protein